MLRNYTKRSTFVVICMFILEINAYYQFESPVKASNSNSIETNSDGSGVNRFTSSLMDFIGLSGNTNNARVPPSHDTPPIPCRCSKSIIKFLAFETGAGFSLRIFIV